jgi:hypothetical protein
LVCPLPYSIFLINQELYHITPSKIEKAEGHNLTGETYQGYVNGLLINAYVISLIIQNSETDMKI